MRHSRMIALTALALSGMLVACGKDATSAGGSSQLSAAETEALAQAMVGLSGGFTPVSFSNVSVASADMMPISFTYSHSLPCPAGGTMTPSVSVSGSMDMTARSGTMDMTGTQAWNACANTVNTRTFTLTGNLQFGSHMSILNGMPTGTQTFSQKGSFQFTRSDGLSGSCTVDMSASMDFASRTRTVTGTFCGRTINNTITFS